MSVVAITAGEKNGLYQYFVGGRPTGIEAEIITAATDSSDIAALCSEFLGNYGEVTHDGDTIFVEINATDRKAYNWAAANQGFAGSWEDWQALSAEDRQSYEDGAAGIPTA